MSGLSTSFQTDLLKFSSKTKSNVQHTTRPSAALDLDDPGQAEVKRGITLDLDVV